MRTLAQVATERLKMRMLVVVGPAENGLKLIANRVLFSQATYWSNVNNERFHQSHRTRRGDRVGLCVEQFRAVERIAIASQRRSRSTRACRDWRTTCRSRGSQARRPAEEVDYQRLHHLLGGRS